jgi:LPS-assembly protein
MKYHRFILSTFFLLFVVLSSIPTHAKMGEVTPVNEKGPINIEADELIYEKETQLYRAHGQVEISRGDFSLKADHAQMNMATKELAAWGNVLLREGEDVIECERLEVNLNTQLGKIHQAKLFMKDQNFHITGREVEKLGENHYRIRDASLTTCDAKRPPWKFAVKEVEVKEMALGGWAFAKGALFYLEDIPVFYFPWGAFPVRLERQTGFLVPRAGYSSKYGPEVKTGFYWAFAKNMDATFYFDYLGDRGFKEGLEYRYALTKETKGEAKFYFIDDKVFDKSRYAFFIEHQQKLPYDFYLKGDINQVSDHKYLDDFNEDLPGRTKLDAATLRQLKSVVFGGKNWDHFSFIAQGAVYDDLTRENNEQTIQKLPQISFYAHPQSLFKTPLFYEVASSYTNFWRERGVEAHRGDLFPRITYPTRLFNVLKFESDLGLRETLYKSHDDTTNTYHGWKTRETLDAGMGISTEFYRVYDGEVVPTISNLFKVSKWMHTIEPTLSYRYSPRVNQNGIPVFDEVDRIPYTNEITYGITQRLVGRPQKETVSSGPYEYAKLILSQSYSLGDPYIDAKGKSRSFSNIRGELWWNFNPYISAQSEVELNPYRGSFDRFDFMIDARDRRNDVFRVQYRNTRGSVQEINLDTRVKTINPLYLFGAFRYNLLDRWMVVSMFGGEYQAQCWSSGIVLEYWGQSPDGLQKREFKVHVYLNLLNIGSVGHKPYFMTW